MKKIACFAVIPLFAVMVCAQQTETTTVTTKTWNGTLVDAACQTTQTEHKETTSDGTASRTKTTRTKTVDCPVTTTTSSFGLLTPEGQYVRFDDPSNTKIVDLVKTNKGWTKFISDREPLKVRVVGTPNGDVIVLESIK